MNGEDYPDHYIDDHYIELMVLTASSQNLGGVRFVPVEKLEISWTSLSKKSPKKN
jgi:hypothetical protein